jgi:protein-S-isoprenylcysteine O-methyltransferase Ste14
LKKYDTPEKFQKTTYLIKKGAYKYSRNPMYLGSIIFLFGLSFVLGNLISFISPIFFFAIINWMFIPYEEEKMKDEIGTEYLEYMKKVRRWI